MVIRHAGGQLVMGHAGTDSGGLGELCGGGLSVGGRLPLKPPHIISSSTAITAITKVLLETLPSSSLSKKGVEERIPCLPAGAAE